jgi:hypothetical protein
MKSMIGGACAALFGLAIAAAPQNAAAGVVGEYNACGAESLSVPVAAAGHTWVAVGTLDAASLQNLDALILRTCSMYAGDADVDAAVANGMDLILDSTYVDSAVLPGAPSMVFNAGNCDINYSLAPASPVTTGPGGTLTDDSLDVGAPGGTGGYCSIMGATSIAALPAGAIPFVTTVDGLNAGALGYSHGAGQVALSNSQWSHAVVYRPGEYLYPGIKTYFINALSWALGTIGEPPVTCASEGYTGTKLEWCKNICERNYSGSTLDMWLRRWINRYHDLPYCAAPSPQPALR